MTTLVVMAKECLPGRVKTRLHPPFSLERAAQIAAASLRDTLEFGNALGVRRRVLCFDGRATPDPAVGWEVVPQRGDGLDERIAGVLGQCSGPTLLVGMDTPQMAREDVARALEWPEAVDAWLGMAADGGFWALGLRRPRGDLVRGIPMSLPDTGRRQRERLQAAGLRVGDLPVLTDIDTADDLAEVENVLPDGHLAQFLRSIG